MSLLILMAAAVGWFMARRAVSGVEAVTRTARKISADSLQERVPVKTTGDEIDQLATTFNQMLDRIQALLTEIKEMNDNIAHDLRSAVARIRGLAEVTLTTGKSPDDFETMAASTIEECDRLLDMINTMLAISKTEAGVEKVSHDKVDIAALIGSACELFEALAEEKNVALRCRAPEKTIVSGDARMLQRMLANLVDNAVKYTPPGGEVEISLSESEKKDVTSHLRYWNRHFRERSFPRFRTILPLRSKPIATRHRTRPEFSPRHRQSPWRRYHGNERPRSGQHFHDYAATGAKAKFEIRSSKFIL